MAVELPIVIAGGGIGGLTTALALSKKGYLTQVLEESANFKELGAGIQLACNVFKMFDLLGITEVMDQVAVFPNNLFVMDGVVGDVILRFPLGKEIEKRFKYPYAVFHRADLLRTLLNECRKSNLVTLIPSSKVIDYEEHADRVIVKTENGSVYEGAALIDAEGRTTNIREKIVGDSPLKLSGQVSYRGIIKSNQMPEKMKNDVFLWCIPDAHFVTYPVAHFENPDKKEIIYNMVAVFNSRQLLEGRKIYGGLDEVQELFACACPEIQQLLKHINPNIKITMSDREPVSKWSKGKATILGDSAHPTLPYIAQGAGLTIEDAVVLANKVDESRGDFTKAFLAYGKERYIRAGHAVLAARLSGSFLMASGVAREVRNQIWKGNPPEKNYDMMAWMWEGISV